MEDDFLLFSSPVKDISPLASIGASPLTVASASTPPTSSSSLSHTRRKSSSSLPRPTRLVFDALPPWNPVQGLLSAADPPLLALGTTTTATQRELVSELVWVLIGFPGTLVNGAGACVDAVGAVHAAAADRILPVGLGYVRVVEAVEQWRAMQSSRVMPALAFAVHSQLQDYRYAVQRLEAIHAGPDGPMTLPQLLHHVHSLAPQIEALGRLCNELSGDGGAATNKTSAASTALNTLYRMYLEAVDPVVQRSLQALLNGTFGPYTLIIDTWMDTGVLVDDDAQELCLTSNGAAVTGASIAFVQPVLHHILAAGRYASALAIEAEPVSIPFDAARVDVWQAAVRSKCSAMAAKVSERLREHHLQEFVNAVHNVCVVMRFSAQLEVALRDLMESSVLDAPPLHALEKRVADLCQTPSLRVSLKASNDPNVCVRQVLVVSAVAKHPLSSIIGGAASTKYGELFVSGHRLVHLRMAVSSLFVEAKRSFSSSCASLNFIRFAMQLLGALLESRVFCATRALATLAATLCSQSVEQMITAHTVYLDRCIQGSLSGQEPYELCLDTIDAFQMYARRVFTSGMAEKLRGMEAKAEAMRQVLQAAFVELHRHIGSKGDDMEPLFNQLQEMVTPR